MRAGRWAGRTSHAARHALGSVFVGGWSDATTRNCQRSLHPLRPGSVRTPPSAHGHVIPAGCTLVGEVSDELVVILFAINKAKEKSLRVVFGSTCCSLPFGVYVCVCVLSSTVLQSGGKKPACSAEFE